MSVQFGRWNFAGQPLTPDDIDKVNGVLQSYGPDGNAYFSRCGVSIVYRAFHTTAEARRGRAGLVYLVTELSVTWDGRLDNRGSLIRDLRGALDDTPNRC